MKQLIIEDTNRRDQSISVCLTALIKEDSIAQAIDACTDDTQISGWAQGVGYLLSWLKNPVTPMKPHERSGLIAYFFDKFEYSLYQAPKAPLHKRLWNVLSRGQTQDREAYDKENMLDVLIPSLLEDGTRFQTTASSKFTSHLVILNRYLRTLKDQIHDDRNLLSYCASYAPEWFLINPLYASAFKDIDDTLLKQVYFHALRNAARDDLLVTSLYQSMTNCQPVHFSLLKQGPGMLKQGPHHYQLLPLVSQSKEQFAAAQTWYKKLLSLIRGREDINKEKEHKSGENHYPLAMVIDSNAWDHGLRHTHPAMVIARWRVYLEKHNVYLPLSLSTELFSNVYQALENWKKAIVDENLTPEQSLHVRLNHTIKAGDFGVVPLSRCQLVLNLDAMEPETQTVLFNMLLHVKQLTSLYLKQAIINSEHMWILSQLSLKSLRLIDCDIAMSGEDWSRFFQGNSRTKVEIQIRDTLFQPHEQGLPKTMQSYNQWQPMQSQGSRQSVLNWLMALKDKSLGHNTLCSSNFTRETCVNTPAPVTIRHDITLESVWDLFESLGQLPEETQTSSREWATEYGINLALNRLLGDKAIVIDPTLSSINSPLDSNPHRSNEGVVNYIKNISCLGEKYKRLPIVMVINTQSVIANSSSDAFAIGGSHWVSCVILPSGYQPPHGNKLGNTIPLLITVDSLKPEYTMPQSFTNALTAGIKDAFSDDQEVWHLIDLPSLYPEIKVLRNPPKRQQSDGISCGYLALFNSLMVVLTGDNEYLKSISQPCQLASRLREMFPELPSKDPKLSLIESIEKQKWTERIQALPNQKAYSSP
ncbi:MAG: hypothetical protein IPP74_03815 [Alphaproteobacteria bacterium]|nr:hypothetical protein [Alphaproteobacteria bacterium]